ncbi:response regulator transcription factor [Thermoleophilia bacterium SCSIO 60948]|nr:response regulator transcription factor [Thermoleophilia bacterium SCSIO 60948]
MSEPVSVLVVDDHAVVRDGLTGMLRSDDRFRVAGEAADGEEAIRMVERRRPDVVVMDLRMPVLDGVGAIRRLAEAGDETPVLVLTTFDTDTDVLPAIEAGATGYLLKDAPRDELFRGVLAAARGESVLAASVASRVIGRVREPAGERLSDREIEVLRLVARGTTNAAAASELFVSEATIKTHLLHIYAKLGASDRASAVARGYELGLLRPGDAAD